MPRSVKEWIGKTADTSIPPRVRQRVWEKHNGTCHICGGEIGKKPWQCDHVKALINGGENRESNLAPAHDICHRGKTAKDTAEKAVIARMKQKDSGARKPKRKMKTRGFDKVEKLAKIDKAAVDLVSIAPKRRNLFQ